MLMYQTCVDASNINGFCWCVKRYVVALTKMMYYLFERSEFILDVVKFGEFIRKKRKERGYNLTQLSEKSGVSHPYLSQIENGKLKKFLLQKY